MRSGPQSVLPPLPAGPAASLAPRQGAGRFAALVSQLLPALRLWEVWDIWAALERGAARGQVRLLGRRTPNHGGAVDERGGALGGAPHARTRLPDGGPLELADA